MALSDPPRAEAREGDAVARAAAAALPPSAVPEAAVSGLEPEALQGVLEAVGEAITVQRPGGDLVWANTAAAELIGFGSAAELLACPVKEVMSRFELFDAGGAPFPPADLPGRRALAGEEPDEILLRWRLRGTGQERWSVVRARPVRDVTGSVRLAVSVFRDVTARHEALEALTRSEARLSFLASASRILLGSSLDAAALAQRVADLAVPGLAEWCSAWDLDPSGRPRRHAVRLAPGFREDLDAELAARPGLLVRHPLWRQVTSGLTVLLQAGTGDGDVLSTGLPEGDPGRRHLAELGARSVLAVPVEVCRSVAGVVLLASTDPDRYGDADVALAEDVARRAGQALDIARAYEAEQEARRVAEDAGARLALLAEVSRALSATLDVDEMLARLEAVVTAGWVDSCLLDLDEAGGRPRRTGPPPAGSDPLAMALTGTTTTAGVESAAETARSARDMLRHLGARSAVVVPLVGTAGVLGAATFATVDRRLSADDVGLAEEVGRRVGAAVENARLFAERSEAAATLSKALLPASLPEIPGAELATRYDPAAGVGGDFYDVVPMGPGRWLVVIGDVCGKGAEAASLTAMARHTVRTTAWVHRDPVEVLNAANAVMAGQLPEGRFCTMVAAVVEPGDEGTQVGIVVAGHPLPLVVRGDGEVAPAGRRGRLMGPFADLGLVRDEVTLAPGDALVMVTDGCVGEGCDGIDVLGPALQPVAGAPAGEVADVVERVAGQVRSGHRDDRTVVVLRAAPRHAAGG